MAAVSQPRSGIPQPVSKARGTSRLSSLQSQFQQREAADRQRKLAELAPTRAAPSEAARPAAAAERTHAESGSRGAAPPRQSPAAPARGRVANGSAGATVSVGARAAPAGPLGPAGSGGKVRAMFQTRRAGTSAAPLTSPVGWDKSYPLDPIKKAAPAARPTAPPPAATKAAAAPAPARAARARRPEPAEPRKPAARAAPAPAPAPAVRRPPPNAAKENLPPARRAAPTDPSMAQCPICQRQFNKDRLEKHQAICEKSSKKKRKVFDPVKMRVKGTESESYLRKIKNKKPEKELQPAKKDWRKQHEEFIRNIRAAKKAQQHLAKGGSLKDLPPPPPMDTSDYVQCPHCSRRFSEAAADRHIPKCSSISSNKAKPAAGRSAAASRKPASRAAPARQRR